MVVQLADAACNLHGGKGIKRRHLLLYSHQHASDAARHLESGPCNILFCNIFRPGSIAEEAQECW